MMFKKLLRLTIPAMAVAGVSQSALAVITTQPYFDVQELPVNEQTQTLVSPNVHHLRGRALSSDGNHIVASVQGFRDSFADFDFNLPYTFQYGCQYADEICEAAWRGYDHSGSADGDGFYNYRESFTSAYGNPANAYSSKLVALISADLSSLTPQNGGFDNVEQYDNALTKFHVAGVSSEDHDTRITDMSPVAIQMLGSSSAVYWVTGYDIDPHGSVPPRGFIESLDGTIHVDLTPYDTTNLSGHGLSAGYHFGQRGSSSDWFVVGTTGVVESEDNDHDDGSFNLCYNREQDIDESDNYQSGEYYRYCPGLKTKTAVWDISNYSDTGTVNGVQTYAITPIISTDDWLGDSDVNHSGAGVSANSDLGLIAGYVTHEDGGGDLDAYARAAIYQYDGSSISRHMLTGNDIVGGDSNDIRDQWAVDVTDSVSGSYYVIGNERYTRHEAVSGSNHNQTVNFFVSQLSNVSESGIVSSGAGDVAWPLRDQPSGASNQIAVIDHSTGMAAGWRETSNNITAYNGIRRTQSAFLFDVAGFEASGSTNNNLWSIQSLTCYTDTTDGVASVQMPLYRIDNVSAVQGDRNNLTVLASGYKYASVSDYIDRWNATPVILKLTHDSSNAPIGNLSGCPVYEPDTHHSRSGGSAGWLALLLVPGLFVRVITKRKQILSAS